MTNKIQMGDRLEEHNLAEEIMNRLTSLDYAGRDTYELDNVHGSEYTDLLDCLRMCTYPLRFHGM